MSPNNGTSSTSTTSDPPTKEEPSPTRHRTLHSGAFANPGTPHSLVLIASLPTLITPRTTMIKLISYKLIHYISSGIPKVCKLLCCGHTFDWLFEYLVRSAFDLDTSQMVSSCNGLACLVRYGNRSTTSDSKFLWNPSIRKFKRLPDPRLSQYFSRD